MRTVRDLAMGLRPSMLDDLGLASALKWQGREFTRQTGTPVEMQIEGNLERLSEDHRTCVYRVVQEGPPTAPVMPRRRASGSPCMGRATGCR